MTAPSRSRVVRAQVDGDGLLAGADSAFLALNARAGGDVGRAIALPQVAMLARLAQKMAIRVSRPAIVADGDDDVELWVDALPGMDGVAIELTGWKACAATPAAAGEGLAAWASSAWHWACDREMRLTHMPMVEADLASAAGKPLTRVFSLEEDAEGALPLLQAVADGAAFIDQPAIVRHNGQPVLLSGTPTHDAAGTWTGFSGTATPRGTDNRGSEPPVKEVASFAEQLDRALRGPLVRIVAGADSIVSRADGPIRRDYALYAADIGDAARYLMGLVDDLVDLEAIQRADFTITPEEVELGDLARRAAGLLAGRAAERQVRIDRPAGGDRAAARGEARRILQILVNLIGNAVRYSPADGMVWLRVESDAGTSSVTVADQGRGIAAEHQDRIFDRFGRVDPGEPGGSGLGLYISRRLARAMGGDVTVDSAPGQGARFTLTLPKRRS